MLSFLQNPLGQRKWYVVFVKGVVQGQNLCFQVYVVWGVVHEIDLKFLECGAHVKEIIGPMPIENIAKPVISVH